MLVSHRSTDAVIAIYQDNDKREIVIHDVNPAAEDMLKYTKNEIIGRDLNSLLPPRIDTLLTEYVEFETYGNDVGSVLNKVNSFCIVDKNKQEHALRVKIQRSTPVDGHDQFNLILQVEQNNRRSEAFRSVLRENFKGHEVLDDNTKLPDRGSLFKDIELVLFYVHKEEFSASVAIIELDDVKQHEEKHGKDGTYAIIRHITKLCRQSLRNDDTLGLVGHGRVGVILFDATDDAAQMVLNRMRWLIAANSCAMDDGSLSSLSVRVAYSTLQQDSVADAVLEDLEKSLDSGDVGSNRVHQTNMAQ